MHRRENQMVVGDSYPKVMGRAGYLKVPLKCGGQIL